MYKELNLNNKNYDIGEIIKRAFAAVDKDINGVCVPSITLSQIAPFVPDGICIACPVDYPVGQASHEIKNHAIVKAANQGANAVDVPINPFHLNDHKISTIVDELKSHQETCVSKNITLRVMLEYRLFDMAMFLDIISHFPEIGIEYVFPSTGYHVDDCVDNAICCYEIQESFPKVRAIANGNIWTSDQLTKVLTAKPFGVRVNDIKPILVYNKARKQ